MTQALTFPSVYAVGSIDAYIQAVRQIPRLTEKQEFDLATRLRNENDLDAARQLVLSHLRLVISVSRGYLGYGIPHADLIQEGSIGLMKAVKRFEPARGVRLVTRGSAGFLCRPLDQSRDSRVHPQELADGEVGNHQGAAQAVLQLAQHAGQPQRRRRTRGCQYRAASECQACRGGRDGHSPIRSRHRI